MTNIRLGVNMNPETAAALRKIANLNGVSVTEAVRRAIAIAAFVEEESRAGAEVQIKRRGEPAVTLELL